MSIVKNIAELLGISPSTVSLVLNNKPGISAATRQRVFDALNEQGYQDYTPRSTAKNKQGVQFVLYKKHGRILADTPFFSHVLEGVEAQAKKHGLNLMVTYLNEDQGVDRQLQSILNTGCRGMILLATEMAFDDLPPFLRSGMPLVVLDSYFEEIPVDTVVINNVQGAYFAVRYLNEMGHKKLGYLKSKTSINNFQERSEGFRKGLKARGLSYHPDYVFSLSPAVDMACQEMRELLTGKPALPTAFFADNDVIAIGAMKALREAGYSIPGDVSVVGFDDIPMCEMLEPPLTTLRVPKQEIGMLAVDRLTAVMESAGAARVKIEIATELVERGSVLNI